MIVNIENFSKIHGFEPYLAVIKLSGEEIKHVVSFDKSDGWLERYIIDESGDYKTNQDEDAFEVERMLGQISVHKMIG